VLLTHWHDDHTGGVPDLLRLYPHLAGAIFKHSPSKGQQPIVNGQIFKVEGATIRALHTPGHAHDHMCFVLEEEQAMLTGDNVLGHGTAVIEHLRTWMASLRVMQSQGCGKGYPAHGAVIPDLGGKIDWELSMKVRRERQALQALHSADNKDGGGWDGRGGKGRHTVKELVTVVYGDKMGDGIRRLALEPCMDEVLRKLAEDGMVGFDMKGGHKRWFAIKSPSH
jgi:glyoxylase-like metal-dependent hydrolase (beta-lactamase superfamily II)